MDERERNELERQIRTKALSKARKNLGFRWHLMMFVLVNALLFGINQMFSPGYQWFIFPLAGWAIGLAVHAFAVFNGPQIDEAAIEAEVQRELARRGLTRA